MTVKATSKFCFRGIWYPTSLVRRAACRSYKLDEMKYESDADLAELVDYIVKGDPTPCADFIVALNEGVVK